MWLARSGVFPESIFLGPAMGRTDFSRIFVFGPPDFFADFVAGFFLLIFVGKSAQKNPPGKSPAKSSKFYTTKIPDTFLQRGRAKYFDDFRISQENLFTLRLGWPATEWETGPEPQMAGGHFSGGFRTGCKMAGPMAGEQKFGRFLAVQPFVWQFFCHFGTPLKNGRRPFRRPFLWPFLVLGPFPIL